MIDRLKFWNRLDPWDRLRVLSYPNAVTDGFMLDLNPVDGLEPPAGRESRIGVLIALVTKKALYPTILTGKGTLHGGRGRRYAAYQYRCGEIIMVVQKQFAEYFLRAYPGAEFRAAGQPQQDVIGVFAGGRLVGAFAPLDQTGSTFTEAVK